MNNVLNNLDLFMGKVYKKKCLTEETNKIKNRGKIYTPDFLVDVILNQANYVSGVINKKHIIENSCGNGQFIVKIVDRYINDFLKKSTDLLKLKAELETYIHAIEVDCDEINVCINRCNELVKKYGIDSVNWNFVCGDTLFIEEFDGIMDYVVGNPPYVRIHNLNDKKDVVKQYLFSDSGMTDLYITFYEMGLKMLNKSGKLVYITPSSFFTSLAGFKMRDYFLSNNLIESICDLKHYQPFDSITYTTIVCLNKNMLTDVMKYYEFDEENKEPILVDSLTKNDYFIDGKFYFSKQTNLRLLREILCNSTKTNISVKNGFATLKDNVFINDFDFESKYIIPIVKASRAKWSKIIYPYDDNGDLINEEILKKEKDLYNYLKSHKEELIDRSIENKNSWYAFGRSQGLKDTYKDKISVNNLIRDVNDLKIVDVPSGSGIYSGLYILSESFSSEEIKNVLLDNEFGVYVSLLGKYKNGGCYTFSSKDIKAYFDYKLGEKKDD